MCKRWRSLGIDSASLCSLAGQYVKEGCRTGPPGWESNPGLLKRLTNTGSENTSNPKMKKQGQGYKVFAGTMRQNHSSRKTVASYIFLTKQNTVTTVYFWQLSINSAPFNCMLRHSFSNCALCVFFRFRSALTAKKRFFYCMKFNRSMLLKKC